MIRWTRDQGKVRDRHGILHLQALRRDPANTTRELQARCCQNRFIHLQQFCGGLARVFPGTAVVESELSVANYEKSPNRLSLCDISLKRIYILHAK
jgi:hypothetical protein